MSYVCEQLIVAIREINENARREVLVRYSEEQLRAYLEQLMELQAKETLVHA